MLVIPFIWLLLKLAFWVVKLTLFVVFVAPYLIFCAATGRRSGIYVGRWLRVPL